MRTVHDRRFPAAPSARKLTRLDLVGLAAEVATIVACTREKAGRRQASADADFDRHCGLLREAVRRWLEPDVQFEAMSDDDPKTAREEFRPNVRLALTLVDTWGRPGAARRSASGRQDDGLCHSAKPSVGWWVLGGTPATCGSRGAMSA